MVQQEISGADAIIKVLEDLKVEYIFGYPGGANLPIYDALRKSKIIHILAKHEQGAAHMADGYARVKGKPGVCLATSGPGVTNIITGLANSYLDSVPVLAITCQIPMKFVGSDAFQEIDCFNLTMHVTKHNEFVNQAEEIVPALRSAYLIANTGRKGPTLVDFPRDVTLIKSVYDLTKLRIMPGYNPKLQGHIGQIKRVHKALTKAEKPLILVGGGVLAAQASDKIVQYAQSTQIPIIRTLMGKGIIPDEHPLFLGMIGTHGTIEGNKAVSQADTLLCIGTRLGDRSTKMMKERFAQHATIIHVDIDPAEIGKNVPVDIPVVSDINNFIHDLQNELIKKPFRHTLWKKSGQQRLVISKADNASIMGIICQALSDINEKLYITTDVGRHQIWANHFCNNKLHLPLLTSGGLGTMGYGLPAAIGAFFADMNTPVINITGDGSFYMNMQEFTVAVEHNIPLTVIIMNDYRLGMIRELQLSSYGKRYTANDFGRDTDFALLAEAMGGTGFTIHDVKDISNVLRTAIDSRRPNIINFDIEKIALSIENKITLVA